LTNVKHLGAGVVPLDIKRIVGRAIHKFIRYHHLLI